MNDAGCAYEYGPYRHALVTLPPSFFPSLLFSSFSLFSRGAGCAIRARELAVLPAAMLERMLLEPGMRRCPRLSLHSEEVAEERRLERAAIRRC